jgi:hypothetical protein
MSGNLSTGTILLICVLYAWKHRGSDAPGMILAFTLGVISSKSALGGIGETIANLIVTFAQAVIDAVNKFLAGGGGTTPAPSPASGLVVAARYNLGLVGIGR